MGGPVFAISSITHQGLDPGAALAARLEALRLAEHDQKPCLKMRLRPPGLKTMRERLRATHRWVVKIGSALITGDGRGWIVSASANGSTRWRT